MARLVPPREQIAKSFGPLPLWPGWSCSVRSALRERRAARLDLAVLSVGDLSPVSTFSEYVLLEREEFAALQAAGAVGDVLCRFIDIDGNIIDHELNKRVIAVDPQELQGARKIVLASGGWQKYGVIRGALRLLNPHVLVTDELVAERLAAEGKT